MKAVARLSFLIEIYDFFICHLKYEKNKNFIAVRQKIRHSICVRKKSWRKRHKV